MGFYLSQKTFRFLKKEFHDKKILMSLSYHLEMSNKYALKQGYIPTDELKTLPMDILLKLVPSKIC